VVNPLRVEEGRAALDPVYDVALLKQKFSKIGTILTRDTGNQGNLA
jgi:hypothetical protein